MKYIYLANGRVGYELCRWLSERGDPPSAVVVHPLERATYRQEIIEASGLAAEQVFCASQLQSRDVSRAIRDFQLELGVSVSFGYLLDPAFLLGCARGCVNLHPALLPFNRGAYPNVWSIVDGTPAGVTLHYIDAGVDTGDIIAQREVAVSPTDTGETLYRKLESASIGLFQDLWPRLKAGTAPRVPQTASVGTCHRVADVERIDCLDLDETYRARDLLNILRARTFPPYKGAYFLEQGRRIYVRVSLEEADEL